MTVHRERRPTPGPIFPRLPGGAGAPPPDRVAADQRARLIGAMVLGVHRSGYRQLTIRELVGLAGVSRSAFYAHFDDKEECFLAALAEVAACGAARVGDHRHAGGLSARLEAGLGDVAEALLAEPAAAHLALVDPLSLGAAAAAGREAAAGPYEDLLLGAFLAAGRPLERPAARWIVSGWRHAAYRALRAGEPRRLLSEVPDLVAWALACPLVGETPMPSLPASVRRRRAGWSAPVRPARTRPARDHRPRLLQASAQIAAEEGAGALSIPAVTRRARTSNVTFYQHFASTEEALLAAFEELCAEVGAILATAFAAQPDRSQGVLAALAAFLLYVSREPIFAGLAFFELPAAGPEGLDRADAALAEVEALLSPSSRGGSGSEHPGAARGATLGALRAAIGHELTAGRAASLPSLGPRLGAHLLVSFSL